MTKTTGTIDERDQETREELHEAAEHRGEAREHRLEGAADRREAAADRAEGDPLAAAGNRLEAAGHDLAARGHQSAAAHDEREAAAAGGTPAYPATPGGATAAGTAAGVTTTAGEGQPLLGDDQLRHFRTRWDAIQSSFIDQPRESVAAADTLVREATDALHSLFENDRRQLEAVWDRGDEVSTEDLRVTLQSYRSFFERLLRI